MCPGKAMTKLPLNNAMITAFASLALTDLTWLPAGCWPALGLCELRSVDAQHSQQRPWQVLPLCCRA